MNTNVLATAAALSDHDLLARLTTLARSEREASAELVAHLSALDARPSLYAARGYGSLHAYCTQGLRLSEDAAAPWKTSHAGEPSVRTRERQGKDAQSDRCPGRDAGPATRCAEPRAEAAYGDAVCTGTERPGRRGRSCRGGIDGAFAGSAGSRSAAHRPAHGSGALSGPVHD